MHIVIYATSFEPFGESRKTPKKYRGWVQIRSTHAKTKKRKNKKARQGRCSVAPTYLALPLYQGFSRVETQKSTQAIVS